MVKGRIHSFESFGTLDGPGVRFVLFMQGCPLRCAYCHNPDTWDAAGGRETDTETLAKEIATYRNFIAKGGVTISGGEPLMQPEFTADLLRRCRAAGFHTAIDTAGSLPPERTREAIDAADLLLLDVKSLDDEVCRALTGCGNANTLATLDYCERTAKPVWLRHVLVPGVTLRRDRLEALADYLTRFRTIQKVELLPFHQMGAFKWRELNLPYPLEQTPVPTGAEMAEAHEIFSRKGLPLT